MKYLYYALFLSLISVLLSCTNGQTEDQQPSRETADGDGQSLIEGLQSEDIDAKMNAYKELVSLGGEAVPLLLDGPKPTLLFYGPHIFHLVGNDAADALVRELQEAENEERKRDMIEALGWIGPEAVEYSDHILPAVSSTSAEVRSTACRTLGLMGATDEQSVDALVLALNDPEYSVVEEAAFALGDTASPDSDDVIRELLRIYNSDENVWIAPAAASSLYKLGYHRDEMLGYIEQYANDDAAPQRLNSFRALTEICNAQSFEMIRSLMRDEDTPNRLYLIELLSNCRTPESLDILLDTVSDPDPGVQFMAITEIGKMGEFAEGVLPELIEIRDRTDSMAISPMNRSSLDLTITLITTDSELSE